MTAAGAAAHPAPPLGGLLRRLHRSLELKTVVYVAVLATVLVFVLLPVLLLVAFSFSVGSPAEPIRIGLDGWRHAVENPTVFGSILNTVKLLVCIHAISFPIAIGIAWVLARTDLPGRNGFEFMFWISFFMPTLAILLGWIMCLDPEYGVLNKVVDLLPFVDGAPFNIYSFWGIVWAHLACHAITVKVMLLTPTFRNIDSSLEEASEVCGASRLATLRRIVVPATMPALIAILLLAMIRAMQSFEIELVLGPPFNFYVYSTQVYSLVGQEPPDFAAASALATMGLMVIAPLIGLQRWISFRRSYATVSGKMKTQPVRLGRWRTPMTILMTVIVLTLTALPVGFLLLASMMKLFGFFDIAEPWTFDHWRTVFTDEAFRQSIGNTLTLAGGASLFAVVLLSLVAYFTVRSKFRGRAVLDFVSWMPSAVPGILFGLGLLYVFLEIPVFRPLYGTMWLMILAVVVSHMTFGTQILKSNLLQLSQDLEEASTVAGASWLHTFTRVILPIIVPAVLLVGTTSFITAARDVASVALVATAGTKTLSLLQLDYMVNGRYGAAAVISFVVIVMSTGLALLARVLGLRIGIRH
ncbi:MAG TPA: iron ABC transporter permease [Alphaproteobacteria bacterium]|nr:iron ABC transporter permease [Alphaproteobacteria bacterium]